MTPFRLDRRWREEPSEFEATFITHGNLYQYGFAVDENRVWGEWLFCRPNKKDTRSRVLFQREYDSESNAYLWNVSKVHVKGEKELWKKSTRDNALFVSTAIQLKSEAFKEVFDWIQRSLRVVSSPERLSPSFTIHQILNENEKDAVIDLLHAVDIGVNSIEIEEKEILATDRFHSRGASDSLLKSLLQRKVYEPKFFHQGTDGELIGFDISEESDGSQVLFNLTGQWLT